MNFPAGSSYALLFDLVRLERMFSLQSNFGLFEGAGETLTFSEFPYSAGDATLRNVLENCCRHKRTKDLFKSNKLQSPKDVSRNK